MSDTLHNPPSIRRRERLVFAVLALAGAFLITRGLVGGPPMTDSFYHVNAANRLVTGEGLTDPYLWTYIGAPDRLPAPSHLYWMPLTSLIAALGMGLVNQPGSYAAAQWPFALTLAAAAFVAFWLGERFGGARRQAWLAGILTLVGGFFVRFWGATDTFAPYALFGSLGLVFIGLGIRRRTNRWQTGGLWLLAGVMAGLCHLTRADGVLLLIVAWAVILWPFYRVTAQRQADLSGLQRGVALAVVTVGYALVMLPWFVRNIQAVGSPLPVGGTQSIWFMEYNDLFNYPAAASPQSLLAEGPGLFLRSRWEAFASNLGTLVAVEGMIVLAPLMLVALWRRRADAFLRGFWLYALGLHLAMTLVFPFPGMRGGLFHSSAALLPWWMALGVTGLDDVVDWVARRRRHWNRGMAKIVFSGALAAFALLLSLSVGLPRRATGETPPLYTSLANRLPADARVMINDPAQLYYYTGLGGVVLPNAEPRVIPEIARRYDVDYLVLEAVTADGQTSLAASEKLASILTAPPAFLTEMTIDIPGVRLYAIHP
ncbi:MAG: hypothetical protein K8J31_24670 [Anaerolineae bacterium]|nr:hypothetical protein [Anaerolineae bacterium]